MSGYLKQSTASQSRALGPFVSDSDFKTVQTGLTIANTDIKLIVNGGASANKTSGGGTHRANGVYGVTFDATDTATVGEMEVSVVVSGALAVFDKFFVIEEAVYDALFGASAPGYLQPATAGRTLVVDANGLADATMVKVGPTGAGTAQTAGDIMADTNDIQTRLPAALVSGRMDASVGAMAASVLTATAINADAITAAKLAADVTTELQAGLATSAALATVQADTDDIQSRLPAALTSGGRMKASVEAILDTAFTEGAGGRIAAAFKQFFNIATPAATMDHGILVDTVTTLTNAPSDSSGVTTLLSRLSALRAGYLDNLSAGAVALEASLQGLITTVGAAGAGLTATATAVWAVATRLLTAGTNIVLAKGTGVTGFNDLDAAGVRTAVGLASANLDTQLSGISTKTNNLPADPADASDVAALIGALPTAAENADAVWDEATADHQSAGTTGKALTDAGAAGTPPTAAAIADAVWDEDLTGHTTPDSAGDTLGSVATGTPPSAAAIADAVWDEDATGHQTQGSFGQAIGDPVADADTIWGLVNTNLNATISSRASQTSVDDVPTNAELATALGTADDAVLAAIAALNNLSQANIRTAVGLASANLDTQLDALPTNSELATALGTADDAVLAAIAALNNLSQANIRTAVGLASANLDTQLDALPTNTELTTALGTADDAVLAAIAALNNLSTAQVKTQVVAALSTDTYAEPGQGAPAATASLAVKLGWLMKAFRNKHEQTATQYLLYDDAGTTVDAKATCSDDGATFTRAEIASGP